MRIGDAGRRSAALIVLTCLLGCGGPFLLFPGGALRGEVVEQPVADWSFADDRFIDVEVRPADPYSVEINYFVRDGRLYIDPAEGRRWLEYIREDPRVRVRLGGRVYSARAVLVEDPAEREGFDPDRFVYRLEGTRPF
jgi:hypothetical protein